MTLLDHGRWLCVECLTSGKITGSNPERHRKKDLSLFEMDLGIIKKAFSLIRPGT